MYQGRVLAGRESHPFLAPESVIEKDPVQFAKQVCFDGFATERPIINARPDKFLRIIRAYGQFKITRIKTGFGWDEQSASLLFPNVSISDSTVIDSDLRIPSGPFSTLLAKYDTKLTKADQQILVSFTEEAEVVLAVLQSLMPVLFASAYRMEPPQTVAVGSSAELLQKIFKMLQLPVGTRGMTSAISHFAQVHRCPFFVKLPAKAIRSKRPEDQPWIDSIGFNNCGYVSAPLEAAIARMTYGQANLVLIPQNRKIHRLEGTVAEVFLKCLLLCLKHLSRYVLDLKIQSDSWHHDLITESRRYLEEELGLSVSKNVFFDGYYDSATFFCDYINLLQRSEALVAEKLQGDLLKVSVAQLGDCYRSHVGMFDFDHIRSMLTQHMLLKEYAVKTHDFILDAEPLSRSPRRLEQLFSSALRR